MDPRLQCIIFVLSFLCMCNLSQSNMRSCVTYTNSQLPEPTLPGWRLTGHVFLRLEVTPIGGDYWWVNIGVLRVILKKLNMLDSSNALHISKVTLLVFRVRCGTLNTNQSRKCECVREFPLIDFNALIWGLSVCEIDFCWTIRTETEAYCLHCSGTGAVLQLIIFCCLLGAREDVFNNTNVNHLTITRESTYASWMMSPWQMIHKLWF